MKPAGKKGFALLLGADPKDKKKRPNDEAMAADSGDDASASGHDDEDDLSDVGDLLGDDDLPGGDGDEPDGDEGGSDPFGGDSSDGDASKIDPEAAALATKLGIHEPHKQQALIDLIQLVTGPGFGVSSPSSSPAAPGASPPESTY